MRLRLFLKARRAAAGRTTFATLYEGDPRDRQAILGRHSEEFTRRIYQKPIAGAAKGFR